MSKFVVDLAKKFFRPADDVGYSMFINYKILPASGRFTAQNSQ